MTTQFRPPITPEDEQERASAIKQQGDSSPDTQLTEEFATLVKMSEEGNNCTVVTEKGEIFEDLRVMNSLDEILLIWGDPRDLKSIPCTLYYRHIPQNGYVSLGAPDYTKIDKERLSYPRPFSF